VPSTPRAPSGPAAVELQDSARAWLVVVAAFAAMFTSFGVAYSFGAFLLPMGAALGSGPGSTAAVFS
jgi:hypothetical protein